MKLYKQFNRHHKLLAQGGIAGHDTRRGEASVTLRADDGSEYTLYVDDNYAGVQMIKALAAGLKINLKNLE